MENYDSMEKFAFFCTKEAKIQRESGSREYLERGAFPRT